MFFSVLLSLNVADLLAEDKADEKNVVVPTDSVYCQSSGSERLHCPANTASGVIMRNSTGSADCLLGKAWGYDDNSVWVKDGYNGQP